MEIQPDFRDLLELFNSWEEAESNQVEGIYGDVKVHYIGREQLILNKKAVRRKKDLADLEALGEDE